MQVAHTLAVAEEAMEFEHRDLHWGNVLVKEVKGTRVCEYKLDGDVFKVLKDLDAIIFLGQLLSHRGQLLWQRLKTFAI